MTARAEDRCVKVPKTFQFHTVWPSPELVETCRIIDGSTKSIFGDFLRSWSLQALLRPLYSNITVRERDCERTKGVSGWVCRGSSNSNCGARFWPLTKMP